VPCGIVFETSVKLALVRLF